MTTRTNTLSMPRFGTPELLFMLSVGVLIVVVAFPMLLIDCSAYWNLL